MTRDISRGSRLRRSIAVALAAVTGCAAAGLVAPAASADTGPAHTVISTGAVWTADTRVYLQPDGGDRTFWFFVKGTGMTGGNSVTFTSSADPSQTVRASFGGDEQGAPCWTPKGSPNSNCRVTVHFPGGSAPGHWEMTQVELAQPDGSVYRQPVTSAIGTQLKVPSVELTAGVNPIQASGFTLSAATADNRAQAQTVTMSMKATDTAGRITQVGPELTGDCWSNAFDLAWSGDTVTMKITVPTSAMTPCVVTSVEVTDDSQRNFDVKAPAGLVITPLQTPATALTIGDVSFQHQVSPDGGTVPVSFPVTDSVPISRVEVTAHGPVSADCAPTASTSVPPGTLTTNVSLYLPFAAAGTTPDGSKPTGCRPGLYALEIVVTDANGTHSFGAAGTPLAKPLDISMGSAGTYVAMAPQRLLDTRGGTTLRGRGVTSLKVAGTAGIPADAVAVVMNVTATNAKDTGFVTVHPAGEPAPITSNLNHTAGQTVPNAVTVQLGAGGAVELLNGSDGDLDLVADVTGYYVPDTTGAVYTGFTPKRVLDTRPTHVPARGTVTVNLCDRARIPYDATAAALNVTVTDPKDQGFLTVYPHGQALPNASTVNFTPGQTISNTAIARIGDGCLVDVFSSAFAPVDIVVDASGYFVPDTSGQTTDGVLVTGTPVRQYDSREGGGPIPGGSSLLGWGMKPRDWGIGSLLLNVTATNPTADSFVTVYPDAGPVDSAPTGAGLPDASNLNFTAGQTIPNLVNAAVGANGYVDFFNHVGSTDLVVDMFGYYTTGVGAKPAPATPKAAGPKSAAAAPSAAPSATGSGARPVNPLELPVAQARTAAGRP
ncbi:hypothetical protein AB0E96_21625 [Kitasatospora sp. NPDC036755]|uniref:hypothetical protein n=1 Tax=Kitasatospora sp. NPDC036755 TaxID=3154600 RepID=UPI0033CDDEE7